MAAKAAPEPERSCVVIVGGGIAGLYAAYLLGRLGHDVQLFEVSRDHWGGRIDSRRFELDKSHDFIAEFGPMRFEAHLQERLRRLCFHLGIEFESFSPTRAPIGTTHYDLTEKEESLESVADLLEWAVLRMFFEDAVKDELSAIEQDGNGRVGPRQFAALKRYMDKTYFCDVSEVDGQTRVAALPNEDIQRNLEKLRAGATLRGRRGAPPLAELGLWNALSEVVTPGALARIRDSGTFYHFIAQNPSALEWGIFWLRQASVMGDLFRFTRDTAPEGTQSLVTKLVDRIRAECPTVRLSLGHEVVQVEHGKRPDEVVLRLTCDDEERSPYSFTQRADHVILALPQQPLLKLAEHFPTDVRARLESVVALPLLKAFLVTKKPWWRHHLEAQTYAWLVPTRELHFFRPIAADCPRLHNPSLNCNCAGELGPRLSENGMIMLYTDQPAIRYWQALMKPEERSRTTWNAYDSSSAPLDEVRAHPEGLLANLIRRLVMIPDPGLARKINLEETKVTNALEARAPELAERIANAPSATLRLAERIFSEIRDDDNSKEIVEQVLRDVGIEVDPEWREWLKLAISYAEFELNPEAQTKKCAKQVRAYGIRDWSAAPFGGAAHVWLPAESAVPQDTPDPLIAFSLRGRADDAYVRNVHVCGEAYSGFQGFIEGALRTAEEVVEAIADEGAANWVFSKDPDLEPKERVWSRKQTAHLTDRWGPASL